MQSPSTHSCIFMFIYIIIIKNEKKKKKKERKSQVKERKKLLQINGISHWHFFIFLKSLCVWVWRNIVVNVAYDLFDGIYELHSHCAFIHSWLVIICLFCESFPLAAELCHHRRRIFIVWCEYLGCLQKISTLYHYWNH